MKIDRYILGKLPEAEAEQFESEYLCDPILTAQIEQRLVELLRAGRIPPDRIWALPGLHLIQPFRQRFAVFGWQSAFTGILFLLFFASSLREPTVVRQPLPTTNEAGQSPLQARSKPPLPKARVVPTYLLLATNLRGDARTVIPFSPRLRLQLIVHETGQYVVQVAGRKYKLQSKPVKQKLILSFEIMGKKGNYEIEAIGPETYIYSVTIK